MKRKKTEKEKNKKQTREGRKICQCARKKKKIERKRDKKEI